MKTLAHKKGGQAQCEAAAHSKDKTRAVILPGSRSTGRKPNDCAQFFRTY